MLAWDQSCQKPTHFGASLEQQRVDAIQAEIRKEEARKRLFRPPPPKPEETIAPSPNLIDHRLAEEIQYIRRLVENMGDEFSSDPIVLQRHAQSLQGFDLVAQLLGHVANIVKAADKDAAVGQVGMTDLKGRLTRKPLL